MTYAVFHKSEQLIAITEHCYYSLISKRKYYENMEFDEKLWLQKSFMQSSIISEKHIITERKFGYTNKAKLVVLKEKSISFDIGKYLSEEKAIAVNIYCLSCFEFTVTSSGIILANQIDLSPIIPLNTMNKAFSFLTLKIFLFFQLSMKQNLHFL